MPTFLDDSVNSRRLWTSVQAFAHKSLDLFVLPVATETCAVILFWLRFGGRVVVSLLALVAVAATAVFGAPPPVAGEGTLRSKPHSVRRYEVREDAATGRLVRVAARRKASSTDTRRAQALSSKAKVVQGESSTSRIQIAALVEQTARQHDVDPELVHAVIRQESGYDPFAVSRKGAMGLMQLMPATADRFGVQNIFDPAENVRGGIEYLRHLLDRYQGDPSLTLAAYNAGEGAVDRYGAVPPYRETENYVKRIRRWLGLEVDSVSNVAEVAEDSEAYPRIVRSVDASGVVCYATE